MHIEPDDDHMETLKRRSVVLLSLMFSLKCFTRPYFQCVFCFMIEMAL